jgi:hypothetical protein
MDFVILIFPTLVFKRAYERNFRHVYNLFSACGSYSITSREMNISIYPKSKKASYE